MTKKNIIYIVATVVVVLLIGYIAYRGFFSDNSGETALNISTEEVAPVAPILSEGTALDFEEIKKYNSQEQLFNYPKPSPDEVSLPLPDLIK